MISAKRLRGIPSQRKDSFKILDPHVTKKKERQQERKKKRKKEKKEKKKERKKERKEREKERKKERKKETKFPSLQVKKCP